MQAAQLAQAPGADHHAADKNRHAESAHIQSALNRVLQKLDQQLLQDTDYLIANETEASFLVGKAVEHLSKDEALMIARQLQKNGAKKDENNCGLGNIIPGNSFCPNQHLFNGFSCVAT